MNKGTPPKKAVNCINEEYNNWVANKDSKRKVTSHKNKVEFSPDTPDEYRQPKEGERFVQDPYTVAENFIDRTQFPLG